jgi:hypothetical protein
MQRVLTNSTSSIQKSFSKAWLSSALVALCFCVTMLFARPAAAQQGQTLVGHVADSSGAVIANATVTIHNEATGVDVVAKTTGAGDYTAPYLNPGTYTITATNTGFKTISKTHVTLSVDQNLKMDFTLPVGDVTETVTVSSEGSQIELSKADRGEIIGNERVEEMPSDGRNYQVLFGLSPGTNNTSNPQYPRQQDNVSSNLHLGGVPQATVQENLDGGTNDTANGWSASNVPLDTIAEFKVVLNPYDASYGRAGGGAVDVALKSGTNKIHGSLYEFARRGWLDAQSYQYDYLKTQPGSTLPVPDRHKRDQFGLEVDGPVYIPHIYNGKDKTFFTGQWEQAYEALPGSGGNTVSLPDPNWTNGNFGTTATEPLGIQYYNNTTHALLPLGIYDPLQPLVIGYVDPVDGKAKNARQQFPGNNCGGPPGTLNNPMPNPPGTVVTCVIPQNRIDPVGHAIAQFYNTVAPNVNPGVGYAPFQNNQFNLPVEYDLSRNGLFKIDQVFGSRDRGNLRWTGFERLDQNSFNGLPDSSPINDNFDSQVQPKEQQYSIEEIHTFSPNMILDNKLTGGTEEQGIHGGYSGFDPTSLGFTKSYIASVQVNNYFPQINTAYLGLSNGGTTGASAVHNLGYQPSVTYIHGRHTFRAGLDMRLYQYANIDNAQNNQFNFGNTFTQHFVTIGDPTGVTSGNSIAELLLGYPNGGSLALQNSPFYSQHYYGIWAQDDWKVTPKLTLNLGIRYDLLGARTERHNQVNYGFDTTTINPLDANLPSHAGLKGPLVGGTLFAGVNGAPRGAYKTNLLNIQPRFGMAYAFSSRTSLRAGFGEEFIADEANDHQNGFNVQTNFNSSLDNNITPVLNNPCGVQSATCTPCVPGTAGCIPIAPGNTLASPYASIIPITGSSLGLATTPGSSINFTDPNFQVPSLWQFSVSLEQLLTKHDTLDISYSGLQGYNFEGSDNINRIPEADYANCDIERNPIVNARQACDGNGAPAQVTSPFYHVAGFPTSTGYYSNKTIQAIQLDRPFPEFTDVTEDHLPQIHTWYNSLQVTLAHNVSRALSLHTAYTWSKAMNSGTLIDSVNRVYGRSISGNDQPNVLTFSAVYFLPFGRGQAVLGHTNHVVDAVIGGWEVSPLYVYSQWYPWSPGNNWEIMSPIAVKIHDLPADAGHSYKRLQGVTPCVAYKDPDNGTLDYGPSYTEAGCTSPALVRTPNQYAVQHNIDFTGVREPANHQFDVSVSKRFAWNERANVQLRLDAFNALNHPNWTYGDSYKNDPTNDNWGTIRKGPDSPYGALPRDLQISGKITF